MRPRIAIPLPHSLDRQYAERAIPQYEHAVERMGGEPVRLGIDLSPELKKHELKKIVERCDGILLPGSKADVDPAKFKAAPSSHSATADRMRESVDELLLEQAYQSGKPVLGICYGLQSLNVFRGGSLIQHIPDFLAEDLRTRVNHEAGKKIAVAHEVTIENNSRLAEILSGENRLRPSGGAPLKLPVNSSHHQSADVIGDSLRIVARCPDDGIIEALEGTDPDHFVLAVQWHPERSVDDDEFSRVIFRSFIEAARVAAKDA